MWTSLRRSRRYNVNRRRYVILNSERDIPVRMKKTALFLVTLLTVAGVGLAGDNPMVGSWEVVSTSGTQKDGTTWETHFAPGRTIKIYSETHFARVATGPDGTFASATAGRYALKGTTLTETVQKANNQVAVGKEWVHEFSIEGDVFTSHLMLIRLFQHTAMGRVGRCPGHHSRKAFSSFRSSSPPRKRARTT